MQGEVEISLNSFYVFNSTFGAKEGEEEKKILFYYPQKTDLVVQVKNVGLSEAIIKFAENFISGEECKSVHMLKTRQLFYQPEPNYWMIMTVNIRPSKLKNGMKDVTDHCEDVHDDVLLSVLKQSYEMYSLFVGSFTSYANNDQNGIAILKQKLHQFFSRYLSRLKNSNCDIIDVFQGMQFLPLDKKTYLHAQSFMNSFQSNFNEQVHHMAFLVKRHLVWSNIESESLRVIYRYLVTNLLTPYIAETTNKEGNSENLFRAENNSAPITYISDSSLGRFLTCPPSYSNNSNVTASKVPKMFIKHENKNIVYQLLVYNVLSSFLCVFIPDTIELSLDFMKMLEGFFKRCMIAFASELSSHLDKKRTTLKTVSSSGNSFGYIYFNKLNLAQKNTLRSLKPAVPPEVLAVLNDICFDKKRNSATGETIVKTYDDYWIVGQFCNEREFYVVTQQKNTTLIEINDEMKKICDKQLKSIYFCI